MTCRNRIVTRAGDVDMGEALQLMDTLAGIEIRNTLPVLTSRPPVCFGATRSNYTDSACLLADDRVCLSRAPGLGMGR